MLHGHPLLPQALAKGPLAITIWADSNHDIQLYYTGIYLPPTSSSAKEDHAVTLVGYGTETLASGASADYWIIKNRWVSLQPRHATQLAGQSGGRLV